MCLSKYKEAVDKYITPAKTVTHKAARQHHNDDGSVDFDDSTPPRKRGKKEDINTDYIGRYYQFLLGSEVNKNDRGPLQRIQQDHMHSLFTKLRGTCKYISECQGLWTKWDHILRNTRSEIYLQVPEKSLILNHVFVKKIQAADWSTEEARAKGPSRICVRVFTSISTDQRSSTVLKVQKHLNQMTRTAYHRSRPAQHVTLAKELGKTEKSVYAGYLRDLSKGNRADQKMYSFLKERVWADALELYGI